MDASRRHGADPSSAGVLAARQRLPSHAPERQALHVPRQHGAWALLAVPLLVGMAAGRPEAAHVLLAIAAVGGYLCVATLQSAAGARSPRRFARSLAVYASVAGVASIVLVAVDPPILLAALVAVPALAVSVALARARRARDLAGSLAQSAQAVVIAPVAASLGGVDDPRTLAEVALVAGIYVVGSVLVVRSVIRERGNARFALASVGFHVAVTFVAIAVLPPAYAVAIALFAARAAAVPAIERWRAGNDLTLKPVFVGLEELAAGIVLVGVAFLVRL